MKNEVKRTFERWITDDAIDGLTYEEEHEILQSANHWFDGAREYVEELGE